MNRYYQACFREYRAGIGSLSESVIKKLGGDTSEAMTLIFTEYTEGTRITPEEAAAVFATFGGENGELIRDEVEYYRGIYEREGFQGLIGQL